MFDLQHNLQGDKVLVWVIRSRLPFERGMWIEIGHENDKHIKYFIDLNSRMGMQVEKDEKGFYRALIYKD